jgi:hypothetical protein
MPRDPTQIECDTISLVRRICPKETNVYDIQVEGNNNFFADGILVHNCVIIDYPVKGAQEAASATYRQHTIEWYQTVLRTRLYPDAAIIIVMTRWHKEDLVGWLLAQEAAGGEQWRVITMPAIAEQSDPLHRKPGDALWPEWFDTKALADIKATMTPYQWLSLYQQRPTDLEGALFKQEYFRSYQTTTVSRHPAYQLDGTNYLHRHLTIFQTVDPAASLKSSADWFVVRDSHLGHYAGQQPPPAGRLPGPRRVAGPPRTAAAGLRKVAADSRRC